MALRTALYDWHVARGARMVDFAGWDMPVQYGSIIDEHQAVRTSAGLFDISHMGRLVFEGPDALELIQRVYTNDAAAMKPGQVRYGLVCNERGGILDDVLVYRLDPGWLMVVNASNREKIIRWLDRQRGSKDVRVADITAAWPMVAVQGPRAVELVGALLESPRWRPEGGGSIEALKYYHLLLPASLRAGAPQGKIISRTGYTGEDGFEIILPESPLHALVEDLFATAARIGIDLRPCGLGARDTLRLEAAMPLYGHELSEEIDPYQAALGWAVKPEKGDFVGRDAMLRRKENGQLPRRVGLELQGRRIAREGAAVVRDGTEVGRVTSGTFAPFLSKAIAMAYVQPNLTAPGTACGVDVRGKAAPARVVSLPFYRRPKH